MTQLNVAAVPWVSRVPETSTAAQAIVQEHLEPLQGWQSSADQQRHW